MSNYDAIVVGAGNGGLTAAARLAKEGKKVLLLEKHNTVGGFATSFVRGRFEFEASLHEMSGYGTPENGGSVLALFQELGIHEQIGWAIVPEAFRVVIDSEEEQLDACMPFGVEAFCKKMEEYVPGSYDSVKAVFNLIDELNTCLDELDGNGKPDATKKEKAGRIKTFLQIAAQDTNSVLHALGMPQKAINIFSTYWSYLGVDLDNMNFFHYANMVEGYVRKCAVVPLHRSHSISAALAKFILDNGGEIRTNSYVEEILTENGAVTGVRIKDGETILCKHIICNCLPQNVFGKLIKDKESFVRETKMTNARPLGGRGFCIFLGLDKSAEELGINEYSYFIYGSSDSAKEVKRMSSIETNDNSVSCCLNNAVPGCSPEGTAVMFFTTLYFEDCWAKVKPEDYFETKRKVADMILARFEKNTGINLRDHIEEIEISTPMTYARYTDAPQGDIYGLLCSAKDSVVLRSVFLDSDEKIPGLHFCGGGGLQGSGFCPSYISGDKAGKRTVADIEKEEQSK